MLNLRILIEGRVYTTNCIGPDISNPAEPVTEVISRSHTDVDLPCTASEQRHSLSGLIGFERQHQSYHVSVCKNGQGLGFGAVEKEVIDPARDFVLHHRPLDSAHHCLVLDEQESRETHDFEVSGELLLSSTQSASTQSAADNQRRTLRSRQEWG